MPGPLPAERSTATRPVAPGRSLLPRALAACFVWSAGLALASAQPPAMRGSSGMSAHRAARPPVAVPGSLAGTSAKAVVSREAREDSLRSIPFERLTPEARIKAQSVIEQSAVFRRLPMQLIDCDPRMFAFLINRPEVVVEIWQVLGMTQAELSRTGPARFEASDGAGTTATVEFLHREPGVHILYADGGYTGPLMPRALRGRALLILNSRQVYGSDGHPYIRLRLDAFLEVDHLAAEAVLRTLQGVVGASADHNFRETAGFLTMLSRAAVSDPARMDALAERLTDLDPSVVARFCKIADDAALDAELGRTPTVSATGQFTPSLNRPAPQMFPVGAEPPAASLQLIPASGAPSIGMPATSGSGSARRTTSPARLRAGM
jgi:hypothetical protein